MKKIFALYIVFFGLMCGPITAQVQDSVVVDSSQTEIVQDSLQTAPIDSLQQHEKEKESFTVIPWKEEMDIGSNQAINDSLLRWQIWPNWGDFYAYRRDAISFRQGTIGRLDAFHINGYEPNEQQVHMEGLVLNDPLTQLPDYNLVPHRKIGVVTEQFGGDLESNIRLRDYYITKPISYLNYDEADGRYRNLEFLVSQNFTERTNVELSYWSRRGGGYYSNSEVTGSQVFGRVYHHLSKRYLLRAMYLRNKLDRDEPFGYLVNDPLAFAFDEFASIPTMNANSTFTRWDLITGIYQREDSASAESGGLEISITKNKENLFFAPDTLKEHVRSIRSRVFKSFEVGGFGLRGDLSLAHQAALGNTPVSKSNWLDVQAEAQVTYRFNPKFELFAEGDIQQRSDTRTGYETVLGLKSLLFDRIRLNGTASTYSRIPTIQAMYWNAGNYTGNKDLSNESGFSVAGKLDASITETITLGASGRFKFGENSSFIAPDSSFYSSGAFQKVSTSVYGRFENHLFEFESSAVMQQALYENATSPLAPLNHQDYIVWLRNSGFIKGYVFDRAAYLKLGVKTLLSPFYYGSRTYNTELGFWQGNSGYQELPPFWRIDPELSARIRGIMIVIRWENALDGLGQAGYFEAAGFPMPPRRLIVGIRAQFRN